MSARIHILAEKNNEYLMELVSSLEAAKLTSTQPVRLRSELPIAEIIVTLGSAGAFTALYNVITSFLNKDKKRTLTVKRDDLTLELKGHSLPEETRLIQLLMPKVIEKKNKSSKKDNR